MPQDGLSAKDFSKKLPKPQHTAEFPSGLITDYIKLVDQLSLNKKQSA